MLWCSRLVVVLNQVRSMSWVDRNKRLSASLSKSVLEVTECDRG